MHYFPAIWLISFVLGVAFVFIGGIFDTVFETEIGEVLAKIGLLLLGTDVVVMCGVIIYGVIAHDFA